MVQENTTIAAISTGMAPGGIGIVRISGPSAREIANCVFRSVNGRSLLQLKGYCAALGDVITPSGEAIDRVVALVFSAPKSYTGEDVVEFSCHGGLAVTRRVLRAVLDAGAVVAGPGEFTRRAFLNGKMDLTQAEAVMGLISASGVESARLAAAGEKGLLSKRIGEIRDRLSGIAAHLAAWADFPEENVPEVESSSLFSELKEVCASLSALRQGYDQGKVFREGVRTVIAGSPNVGKSTLMNLLSGCQRSIVTEYAGTTRDVVEETVLLGDIPLRLADTAGLRETDDPVESIGVEAARERLSTAQLVLAVFDPSREWEKRELAWIEELKHFPVIAVINKSDLPEEADLSPILSSFSHVVRISAKNGEGVDALEKEVSDFLDTNSFDPSAGALFTERQKEEVESAEKAIQEGIEALEMGMTLDAVTVCVEDGLNALYALTGEKATEEIVNRVFEDFCVGK